MQTRLEATEGMLHSARRDASDAVEHARSSAGALAQLQGATDKHWQITRASREEQAQLVKAVRALLLNAELQVSDEVTASHPSNATELGEYGKHGWSSPAARHLNGGAGGGAGSCSGTKTLTASPLPRVAAASSAVGGGTGGLGAATSSPLKRLPHPPGTNVSASGPFTDVDLLQRRRRLLAGAGLDNSPGLEGTVTLPSALALPSGDRIVHASGAQTHRSPIGGIHRGAPPSSFAQARLS